MLTTMPVWGAGGSLPAAAESRPRAGNVQGSLIDGTVVTTFDGPKPEQDWYAVTLAKESPVEVVVFTHGAIFHDCGWFDTSKEKAKEQVQAVKDSPWTKVGELTNYPATTAIEAKFLGRHCSGTRSTCTLAAPMKALALRVIGRPACGNDSKQSFSSCDGLAVYEC
ncbi:MAG: hypothetical protein WCH40_04575 [Verrucomicrobiales bacterium]